MKQDQKDALLAKPGSNNPLYLLAALEELRTLGTYAITDRIRELPGGARALFTWILKERLSRDPGFRDANGNLIGAELVRRFSSYLGGSRHGLSQMELAELAAPGDPRADPPIPPDSQGNVAALQRLLRPHLMHRGGLLDFYHGQFREAVEAEYLGDDRKRTAAHRELARYFRSQADPDDDGAWSGKELRGLSELAHHHYRQALASGDCQPLFDLVDDGTFKKRQFERLGEPQQIAEEMDHAVDLAVRNDLPSRLVHYSMMRSRLSNALYKTYLYRLVGMAKEDPALARSVVTLVHDPVLRRMGMVLVSWVYSRQEGGRELASELVADAARIRPPATACQAPALLNMTKDLYCAGIDEARELLRAVPACPPRQRYETAWQTAQERLQDLADALRAGDAHCHKLSDQDLDQFSRIQTHVRNLRKNPSWTNYPEAMEEQFFERFGATDVSAAYFLMAVDPLATGNLEFAEVLLNRAVFLACARPAPAVRMLSALVEVLRKSGDAELAEDHADRVRTFAKMLERMAKTPRERGIVSDAISELALAVDKRARVWRPPGADALFENVLAGQAEEAQADPLNKLANARQLLSSEHPAAVPRIMRGILQELAQGGHPEREAILIAVHAMSRVCGETDLAAACVSQLEPHDLHPDALYRPGDEDPHAEAVLRTVAGADPRCAAALALALRLSGLRKRLYEFVRVASRTGVPTEALDALLAQVIRTPGIASQTLRQIGRDALGAAKQLVIPSGLGWYYYPGIMLCQGWSGILLAGLGISAAMATPELFAMAALLIAAGSGGALDLVVWRFMRLWQRPEISRRLLVPELASILCFVFAVMGMQSWLQTVNRTGIGCGFLTALVLAGIATAIAGVRGHLFRPLSSRFLVAGTVGCLVLAAFLGRSVGPLIGDRVPRAFHQGIFLGGACLIGFGLDILVKRIAVLRHYGTEGDFEKVHGPFGGTINER